MNTRRMFVVGALLLAACQFQAHTEVLPDGSGELRTEVGFSAEERQKLIQQGTGTADDFCNTAQRSTRDVRVTEAQRGAETWCVTVTRFRNLNELQRLYEEQKGVRVNRLALTESGFEYDLELDTASTESSLSAFSAITWTVTLPGAPGEHNATEANGQTLTWHVTPKSGLVNLRAESAVERSADLFSAGWWLPLLMVGIAGLAIVGIMLAYRRSRSGAAV